MRIDVQGRRLEIGTRCYSVAGERIVVVNVLEVAVASRITSCSRARRAMIRKRRYKCVRKSVARRGSAYTDYGSALSWTRKREAGIDEGGVLVVCWRGGLKGVARSRDRGIGGGYRSNENSGETYMYM